MIDVVCGVIEDAEGNLLVCRRPPGKHLGGLWEFPGGKIDEGETATEALIRELREELHIGVTVGPPLQPVIWDYDTVSIRLIPYRCRIASGEPSPVEHDEIRWCPKNTAKTLQWAPADLPILREINAITGKGPIDTGNQ